MPNLVSVDVSVADDRVSLVFSHQAVAAAYAAYLKSEDTRQQQQRSSSPFASPHHSPQLNNQNPYRAVQTATATSPLQGYRRAPHFSPATKEVTFFLPSFITWFITCRLPDDEDAVTFSFIDADEQAAAKWAEGMLLFELVPPSAYDDVKQLHVRRLWNKDRLLKHLENLSQQQQQQQRPGSGGSGSWQQGGPVQGLAAGYHGVGGYAPVSGGKTNSAGTSPRGSVRSSPSSAPGYHHHHHYQHHHHGRTGSHGQAAHLNGLGVAMHAGVGGGGQKRAKDVWW